MRISTAFLLLLSILLPLSHNFHVQRVYTFPFLTPQITAIDAISDTQLMLTRTNGPKSEFILRTGYKYGDVIKTTTTNNSPRNARIEKQALYVGTMRSIAEIPHKARAIMKGLSRRSNSNTITMDSRSVFGIEDHCGALVEIDAKIGDLRQYRLEQGSGCVYEGKGAYLHVLEEGRIAVVIGGGVYLLSSDMEVLWRGGVEGVDLDYVTELQGDVIARDINKVYYQFIKTSDEQQYQLTNQFYLPGPPATPTPTLLLTPLHSRLLLLPPYTPTLPILPQPLHYLQPVLVTLDESHLLTVSAIDNKLTLHQIDDNFTVKWQEEVEVEEGWRVVEESGVELEKGVMVGVRREGGAWVAVWMGGGVVRVGQGWSEGWYCEGYGVGREDEGVVMLVRVQGQNETTYMLQARNVSTLEVMYSQPFTFQAQTQRKFTILRSKQWVSTFLVHIYDPTFQQPSQTILFSQTPQQFTPVKTIPGLYNPKVVGKCIVAYSQNHLTIYNYDMKIVKSYYYEGQGNQKLGQIYAEQTKARFLFQAFGEQGLVDVFDLSNQDPDNWRTMFYFPQFYNQYEDKPKFKTIFLPSRKVLITYAFAPEPVLPTAIAYNLDPSSLPIPQQILPLPSPPPGQPHLYLPVSQNCSLGTMISLSNTTLLKHSLCEAPYPQPQIIEINNDGSFAELVDPKLTVSQDGRKLVLKFGEYVQVRAIENVGKILWQYQAQEQLQSAVVDGDGQVIMTMDTKMQRMQMYEMMFAEYLSLGSGFEGFASSSSKSIVFYSRVYNTSKSKIVYKEAISGEEQKELIVDYLLSFVDIDNQGKYFCACDQSGDLLQIWKVQGTDITKIYSQVFNSIKSAKFSLNGEIYVETTDGKLIKVNFIKSQQISEQTVQQSPVITAYKFSLDFSLLAIATNTGLTVTISQTATSQVKATLHNPIPISSLTFLPSKTLLLSSPPSMYSLPPTQCPSTFVQDPNNLTCNCPTNFFPLESACICKPNYQYQPISKTCNCLQGFTEQQGQCSCPDGYITNNKCIKCQFPCSKCKDTRRQCIEYSVGFYWVIVVGVVVGLGLVGIAFWALLNKKLCFEERRKKRGKSKLESEYFKL